MDFYRRKAARSERTRVHPVWEETHGIHRQHELRQPRGYLAGVDRILQIRLLLEGVKLPNGRRENTYLSLVISLWVKSLRSQNSSSRIARFLLSPDPLNWTESLIYGDQNQ